MLDHRFSVHDSWHREKNWRAFLTRISTCCKYARAVCILTWFNIFTWVGGDKTPRLLSHSDQAPTPSHLYFNLSSTRICREYAGRYENRHHSPLSLTDLARDNLLNILQKRLSNLTAVQCWSRSPHVTFLGEPGTTVLALLSILTELDCHF